MRLRILASLIVGLLLPTIGNAQSIGFNFNSDREDAALGAAESAGVAPQVNWNNWDGIPSDVTDDTMQTQAEIASPNAGIVTDSSGATHADVTVNWQSRNAWNTDNGVSNGDNKLMNGYIDNNAGSPQVTVGVGGLPPAIATGATAYDVIVYIGSDGNGRTGTVTDGATTYSYSTFSQQAGTFPGAYTRTTDTAGGNPDANYAVFSGKGGDSVSITLDRGSSNSGIHGVQIAPLTPVFAPGDSVAGGQRVGDNFEFGVAGTAGGVNNWPGGESPDHAIDGVGQKYLNFGEFDTGFIVTPSAGPSIAEGIKFWTANDEQPRDPTGYELWGTNADVSGPDLVAMTDFQPISVGDLDLPDSRNGGGDSTLLVENSQFIDLEGGAAGGLGSVFTSYLVIFPDVKDSASANSMQIAEVQVFGTIVPEPSTAVSALALLLLVPLARRRRRK